ncbi:MAG: VOC family protein [Hyphomicrobiales bacterium]|nr:VOC family protein [Hyphomicrobiales bacterium]
MACVLDHLVVVAPTLEHGAAHVARQTGFVMRAGGRHPQMGTHNLLLRLGESVFLEVIALDRAARRPENARWFGLDGQTRVRADWAAGRRLRGFVARTSMLGPLLGREGAALGQQRRVSRGDRAWDFAVRADGSWPLDGAAPCLIDWGARGPAALDMPISGARLQRVLIECPDPEAAAGCYQAIGLADPPALRRGPHTRLLAVIETPQGERILS